MERAGVVEKADNASGLDGYHCINAEKEKVPGSGAKERGDMYKNITPQWKAVNALDMACFDEECFDFVFEKSTSDAIACGDCDGSLLKKLENEIYRVTKPGSKWLSVSYSSSRWDGIIQTSRWDANVIKIKIDTDTTDGEKTTSHTVMRPEVYQNCYVFTKKIPKC
ncbi:hypothetical protein AX774_g7120 [Zancudomyces culisetae]|uniref:Methyltransferase type 11 domain-containing protein n=1 Tax=Zancudomyces culisetae TaxID=1213189 RepID=A0A1R1PEQ3_ZANCU|nr:hypothetical protein AX774_g7120 [Zancudomyces culisetae]|eukprot:OMH79470.1 hypothetical protein AX774_g7120 [Zancudomyces culisetae]